ncbi:hypothetical protein EW146_g10004 [Bondarzewia mesenterica]|uniref:DUF1793-domain-containing protein n=1 Tax=Bondarzewia mesenterica TaxID=1095465 RepID=A0A4S4L1A0_9AGAM|nr:hypothetical protein EW146_g10004 [Bondarzewia mesenterica]
MVFPPALPLAVRSPYLHSWEAATATSHPPNEWPVTWVNPGPAILGWAGFIRVDNTSYAWLGDFLSAGNSTNLTATSFTPTRTVLSLLAGPMAVNVTFLSPIEVNDRILQSIPFSYLYLEAKSVDGQPHTVDVYSDISAEWNSGDRNQGILWNTTVNQERASVYHSVVLQAQVPFDEIKQQAEWGTLYYAMKLDHGVTYKINSDVNTRGLFHDTGSLDNQTDPNFRAISASFPVFGIARSLGSITETADPIIWAIGYARDPAVLYTDLTNTAQERYLYFRSKYSTDDTLINDFLNDFPNAKQRADQLDQRILSDARGISSEYADIVSLAARQVYAATELTIGRGSDGSYNQSDIMMFMKNIGDKTSPNRVNPVETLYAAWPMFMYIDPSVGEYLLEPLLRFQASSSYQNNFAAQDIGSGYPKAQGSSTNHPQGIEQSANMIIMAYAHARATGNGNLVNEYYNLFTRWTDYLVNSTLFPANQLSADLNNAANQTNLAVKGIIAIKAMAELSSSLKMSSDAQKYADQASSLIQQWQTHALSASSRNLLATYGQSNSWSLGYNLFADRWLGTNLVPSEVFSAQAALSSNLISGGTYKFGLPVDSSVPDLATSSWDMFAAAMTNNDSARDQIISLIHAHASFNGTTPSNDISPFPTAYDVSTGQASSGAASPAQGAVFAPLALNVKINTITATNDGPGTESGSIPGVGSHTTNRSNAGAIAGGVIGGLALLALLGLAAFFLARRRHRQQQQAQIETVGSVPTLTTVFTPYQPLGARPNYRISDSITPHFVLSSTMQTSDTGHDRGNATTITSTSEYSQSGGLASPPQFALAPPPPPPHARRHLSEKELARLRVMNASNSISINSSSQHTRTMSNASRALSTLAGSRSERSAHSARTTTSGSDSVANQLMSEVEGLRRQMEQIRAERSEPPPMYYEQ